MPQPKHFRVFISSPGDVSDERKSALEVLERLPRRPAFKGRITIEPVAYDDPHASTPMHAGETPQLSVSRYSAPPRDCDLTIVILWSRLGTPLPESETRPDGTRYASGTVWEYEDANAAGRPVFVYRRTSKPQLDVDDPQFDAKRDEYKRVKAFFDQFQSADRSILGGVNQYPDPSAFQALLEQHLEAFINKVLQGEAPPIRGAESQHAERYDREIELYRQEFLKRHRKLDLDGLMPVDRGEIARIPLSAVFVEPRVQEDVSEGLLTRGPAAETVGQPIPQAAEVRRRSLENVRRVRDANILQKAQPAFEILGGEEASRAVLLGDPGGGKSTLTRYVALALLDDQNGDPRARTAFPGTLPVVLELRSYAALRPPAGACKDVFAFIDELRKRDGYYPSAAGIRDRLARAQPTLFIFDGLDEVFDSDQRELIAREIGKLTLDHPQLGIVATSRPAGYQRKFLEDAGFTHYRLQEMDEALIRTFLQRWYREILGEDAEQAGRLTERLLGDLALSDSVRKLAGNPLLLTILAIMGRTHSLPRERWRLYEHATNVLIHHWDVSRQLKDAKAPLFVDEEDKRELLRRLAADMQAGTEGLAGNAVSQADLERTFETYLTSRYKVPTAEAAVAGRSIIQRLYERNFIIAPRGGGLFGFVHRAFLEYFCASSIVHKFEKSRELSIEQLTTEVFDRHVGDASWLEVLRLIAGTIDTQFAGRLIEHLRTTTPHEGSVPRRLAVAVQCFAELRRPDDVPARAVTLLEWICRTFDEDSQRDPPLLFSFLREQVVPHVVSVGIRWPERRRLAAILAQRPDCLTSYIYDDLFGTTIGSIGAGDPTVHGAVLAYADHGNPTYRVLAPFALAKGWPSEETCGRLLQFARQDAAPTVRYAAIYALSVHFGDRPDVRALVEDKLEAGNYFDRAAAVSAFARITADPAKLLAMLDRCLRRDPEKWPRNVMVQALVDKCVDEPTRVVLLRIARTDPSPTADQVEDPGNSWFPRQTALRGLVQHWPRHPDTLAVLKERAEKDQTPWLRDWCRLTEGRLRSGLRATAD